MVELLSATVGRIEHDWGGGATGLPYFSLFITPEGKAVCEQSFRDAAIRMGS
jgi:hypothetical protein